MVGARRASIMVFDEAAGVLRTVAARGFGVDGLDAGAGGRRVLGGGAGVPRAAGRGVRSVAPGRRSPTDCGEPRGYRGQAFLSVPICYGAPGLAAPLRRGHQPDRPPRRRPVHPERPEAGDARSPTRSARRWRTRGWSSATAQQQRLRHELELAHDLQLKLLPSPARAAGRRRGGGALPAGGLGGRRLLHLLAGWAAAGWASCWATWRRTASRRRW